MKKKVTCTHNYNGEVYSFEYHRENNITHLTISDEGWINVTICVFRFPTSVGGYALAYELHPEYGQHNIVCIDNTIDQLVTTNYMRKQLMDLLMCELVTNILNRKNCTDSTHALNCVLAFCDFLNTRNA